MTTSQLSAIGTPPQSRSSSTYHVRLAADADDVLAAQKPRQEVFGEEWGAYTPGPQGIDADPFDDLCDHLIVRCTDSGDEPYATGSPVVATYRLLPPHANDCSPRATGLYSHREFDLSPLESILDQTVEAGRSCVAAQHRGGAPISLLWSGITRYMEMTGYRYLVGCASISLEDGGANAAAFAELIKDKYAAPQSLRCSPRIPWESTGIATPVRPSTPPLLRGYLRLGAVVCGGPAIDVAFHSADFLVLLDLKSADQRYLRFFSGHSSRQLLERR